MMRVLVIILLLCSCSFISGQDFKSRLELMKKEYADISHILIRMKILVYESAEAAEPLFNQEAIIKKQDRNFFYQFDQIEMLMNRDYIIVVDETSRQIVCTDRSLKDEAKFLDPFQSSLDSVLRFNEDPFLVRSTQDVDQYQLAPTDEEIKIIDLFVNKATNLLTRIDYTYEAGYKAQIFFTIFDRSAVFSEADFSESKYIVKEKGSIRTTPQYSRFNLAVN